MANNLVQTRERNLHGGRQTSCRPQYSNRTTLEAAWLFGRYSLALLFTICSLALLSPILPRDEAFMMIASLKRSESSV